MPEEDVAEGPVAASLNVFEDKEEELPVQEEEVEEAAVKAVDEDEEEQIEQSAAEPGAVSDEEMVEDVEE